MTAIVRVILGRRGAGFRYCRSELISSGLFPVDRQDMTRRSISLASVGPSHCCFCDRRAARFVPPPTRTGFFLSGTIDVPDYGICGPFSLPVRGEEENTCTCTCTSRVVAMDLICRDTSDGPSASTTMPSWTGRPVAPGQAGQVLVLEHADLVSLV